MGNASIPTRLPQVDDSVGMLLARIAPVSRSGVGLVSAARTTTTSTSSIDVGGARVLTVFLDVTATPGSGGLSVGVEMQDPITGQWSTCLFPSAPVVASVGLTQYQMPGGTVSSTGCAVAALTPNVRIRVTHSSAVSYTYSVSYVLSP
jgi:hypothetical protein